MKTWNPSGFVVAEVYAKDQLPEALQRPDVSRGGLEDLLREQGKTVNAVRIARPPSDGTGVADRVPAGWYHIVYPAHQASTWIYIER
jgi:hypothetical protein